MPEEASSSAKEEKFYIDLAKENHFSLKNAEKYLPKSSADIKTPKLIFEQVIGQDEAVEIAKKAALQKRNLMLIGNPGTGKSMIGKGLSECLPVENLEDIVCLHNFDTESNPLIETIPSGFCDMFSEELKELYKRMGKRNWRKVIKKAKEILLNELNISSKKDAITKSIDWEGLFNLAINPLLNRKEYRKEILKEKKLKIENIAFSELYDVLKVSKNGSVLFDILKNDSPLFDILKRYESMPKEDFFITKGRTPKEELCGLIKAVQNINYKKPHNIEFGVDLNKLTNKLIYSGIGCVGATVAAGLLLNNSTLLPLMSIGLMLLLFGIIFKVMPSISGVSGGIKKTEPYLLVNNSTNRTAPFIDATGSQAENLLGDIEHDPYGKGGTAYHTRVKPGLVHKANKGVLFIDELALMSARVQDMLKTAMEDKKMPIQAYNPQSSSISIKTEKAPCDFILVVAGTLDQIFADKEGNVKIHPAIRDRIQSYGYEVLMKDEMDDNIENRIKFSRFVSQEVKKIGNIPHFSQEAIITLIKEAKRRTYDPRKLTLRLRNISGIIEKAGDFCISKAIGKNFSEYLELKDKDAYKNRIAQIKEESFVAKEDVLEGIRLHKPIEEQKMEELMEKEEKYLLKRKQENVSGVINGLYVKEISRGQYYNYLGGVSLVESKLVKDKSPLSNILLAPDEYGKIAEKSVEIVRTYLKELTKGKKGFNLTLSFSQTYEKIDGDSATLAVLLSCVSELANLPIPRDIAITSSLSLKEEVLPIGGLTPKIDAAIKRGLKKVLIPERNYMVDFDEETIDDYKQKGIEIIKLNMLGGAYNVVFGKTKQELIKIIQKRLKTF